MFKRSTGKKDPVTKDYRLITQEHTGEQLLTIHDIQAEIMQVRDHMTLFVAPVRTAGCTLAAAA